MHIIVHFQWLYGTLRDVLVGLPSYRVDYTTGKDSVIRDPDLTTLSRPECP